MMSSENSITIKLHKIRWKAVFKKTKYNLPPYNVHEKKANYKTSELESKTPASRCPSP